MKDPAVLFYFQDFLVGTEFMTDEETGKYIRILCHQADKETLSLTQLERICKGKVPTAIMEKLTKNGDGKYYQKRMQEEREKRINYSESRRINRSKKNIKICKTHDKRMENENENINKDINNKKGEELLRKREDEFIKSVLEFKDQYPSKMLNAFILYWTEKNRSNTKMRFELEKTFEISKRLATWASRDKEFNKIEGPKTYDEMLKMAETNPDIWKQYKSVKQESERKAVFYPINT